MGFQFVTLLRLLKIPSLAPKFTNHLKGTSREFNEGKKKTKNKNRTKTKTRRLFELGQKSRFVEQVLD